MTRVFNTLLAALIGLFSASLVRAQAAPDSQTQTVLMQPAAKQKNPSSGLLLAAARAGNRIVAVGAHGVVVLSDDDGKSFRQASVPVRLQLTGLFFIDDKTGWATGHGGLILRTDDAGENWAVQRTSFEADQPLFSVYFRSKEEGWAVGLWSLMVHTRDGGKTWTRVELPTAPGQRKADLNLFRVFGDGRGGVFVACERGFILQSSDGGEQWHYQASGYQGSLWTGAAWPDGTVLVAGLRGALYRSIDHGKTWSPAGPRQTSSITSFVKVGKAVYGVGFEGLLLSSADQGLTFKESRRPDSLPLTAIVPTASGDLITFARSGVPMSSALKALTSP